MRKVYQLVLFAAAFPLVSSATGLKKDCAGDLRDKAQILQALSIPAEIVGNGSKTGSVVDTLARLLPAQAKKAEIVPQVKNDIDEVQFKLGGGLFRPESVKIVFRVEGRTAETFAIRNYHDGKPVRLSVSRDKDTYQVVVESLGRKTFFLYLYYNLDGDLVGMKLYTRKGQQPEHVTTLKVADRSESGGLLQ